MLKNGFIIKSNENQLNRSTMDPYFGIGRNITWPLDGLADDVSVELTAEAERRWFGYSDSRPWVIPDVDYLKRYKLPIHEHFNILSASRKFKFDHLIFSRAANHQNPWLRLRRC